MRRPLFAMQRRGVQSVLCRGAVCNRIGQGILSAETSVSEIWKTARGSKEGVVHRCVLRMDARVICRRGDSVSMRSAVNPFWGRLKARRATSRAGLKSIRVLRPFRRLIDFAVLIEVVRQAVRSEDQRERRLNRSGASLAPVCTVDLFRFDAFSFSVGGGLETTLCVIQTGQEHWRAKRLPLAHPSQSVTQFRGFCKFVAHDPKVNGLQAHTTKMGTTGSRCGVRLRFWCLLASRLR